MKSLQIVSRDASALYGAMIRKQAEIHKNGRGTFVRGRAKTRGAAHWTHLRYRGSIDLRPDQDAGVSAKIKSSDHGDEARLLSSFLGWLDRHFGKQLSSVNIQYQ